MKIGRFLIFLLVAGGIIVALPCSGVAQPLQANGASPFYYAFFESTLTLKNEGFHPRFFTKSTGSGFETGLSLLRKAPLSASYPHALGERNPLALKSQRKGINHGRAWLLGTANAGAIFFGLRQAIDSWGKTKSKFHLKDDWKGDNLAQIDELSHFMWGYKMTQFLFSAYRWAGFSSKSSHVISISQTAFILTVVEYPVDAYNPQQGFGVSDLVFDYAGIGLAWMKERKSWLEDFDVKMSPKRSILMGTQPVFAQTYEEFDNFIYWLTYRTRLFLPQKALCFGLGYSVTHRDNKPKRQFFGGIGLSLPDFASLFGRRLKRHFKFLEIFYPNLSIKL
jgi:hypothetical protein